MKLKEITFDFENCDSLTIEGKYVNRFSIEDIKTSFRHICNETYKRDVAHVFAIEIHKDANKERYQFDQTQIESFKQSVFERLTSYNDIVSIQFVLTDSYQDKDQEEKEYSYYLSWTGESDFENASQKSVINDLSNLCIVVSEKKSIEDYFSFGNINNKETKA